MTRKWQSSICHIIGTHIQIDNKHNKLTSIITANLTDVIDNFLCGGEFPTKLSMFSFAMHPTHRVAPLILWITNRNAIASDLLEFRIQRIIARVFEFSPRNSTNINWSLICAILPQMHIDTHTRTILNEYISTRQIKKWNELRIESYSCISFGLVWFGLVLY